MPKQTYLVFGMMVTTEDCNLCTKCSLHPSTERQTSPEQK